MKLIVDTMGSDNGCAELTKGIIDAVREFDIDAAAVGDQSVIEPLVAQAGLAGRIQVVHAPIAVTMEDEPNVVMRGEKAASSMVTAMKLLSAGGGDAVVTAGNTGAAIMSSTLYVGRIRGIRRAALAPILPVGSNGVLLIDSGANVQCTAEYLLQFAYLGSYYMRFVLKRGSGNLPTVGLLNIGAESHKGDDVHRKAYELLKAAGDAGRLNFVGNIEGRDVPSGKADVVVADGFSGNICLKSLEGIGLFFVGELKKAMFSSTRAKLGALLLKPSLAPLRKKMNYKEIGGSPLVGIAAPVIKAHGSADAFTMKNAMRQAMQYVNGDMIRRITENIDCMKAAE